VWPLHCHIEFHTVSGFVATIIEAPELLSDLQIPQDHIEACKAYPMDYVGNAGGNLVNPLNLSNAVTTVPTADHGYALD
jgi:iron transport multicopper oxidase